MLIAIVTHHNNSALGGWSPSNPLTTSLYANVFNIVGLAHTNYTVVPSALEDGVHNAPCSRLCDTSKHTYVRPGH